MIMLYSWNWADRRATHIDVRLEVNTKDDRGRDVDLFDGKTKVWVSKPEWFFNWRVNRAKTRLMKEFRKQCKDRVAHDERIAMAERIKEIPRK